jgi:phosphoribosyl-ATP pyrophosphohydrolase
MSDVLQKLWATIDDRRVFPRADSYTSSLLAAGLPRISQKVGEEAVETVVAALGEDDSRVVYEMADLVYHCMVLLAAKGLTWAEVESALEQRFK